MAENWQSLLNEPAFWLAVVVCIGAIYFWIQLRKTFQKKDSGWTKTAKGNYTMVADGYRFTVFWSEPEYGWKYCAAKDAPNSAPYFSDDYFDEPKEAMEALAEDLPNIRAGLFTRDRLP